MNGSNECDLGERSRDIYCYPHSAVCVRPTFVGVQILFLVCMIILSVTSCTLLIYVVHRTRSMATSMKACIMSLSFAYLLSAVYPIPILCYSIVYSHLVVADIVCRSSPVVVMVTSISTNWTLALVGVDRFLTIFRPFTYQLTMNLRKSLAMVVSTWCIGIAFAAPSCLGWGGVGICFQPRVLQICGVRWTASRAFSYITWCLTVALPLCLLVFCYLKIALLARSMVEPCHIGNDVIRTAHGHNIPTQRRLVYRTSITTSLKTFKIVIINIEAVTETHATAMVDLCQTWVSQYLKYAPERHGGGGRQMAELIVRGNKTSLKTQRTICLCWAPYSVLSVLSLDTDRANITYSQDFMGYCLLFLPNFVNPVVFIAFNGDYRDSVTRLWYRMWRPLRDNSIRTRPRLHSNSTATTTAGNSVGTASTVTRVFVRHVNCEQ